MSEGTGGYIKMARVKAPTGWKAQELITFDDIKMYLDAMLKISIHPVPQGMVGNLYVIDGKLKVAEAIMNRLEERSKLFGVYTKPNKEIKNGEEERNTEGSKTG